MTSRISIYVFLLFYLVGFSSCTGKERPRERAPSSDVSQLNPQPKFAITVMSWNMKHLGRKKQNTAEVAKMVQDADILTLQEVNTKEEGLGALMQLASELRKLVPSERVCVGLSVIPSDGDERYAYIWKDSRIAYVKTNGEVMETCPSSAITIPTVEKNKDLIVREPAIGTFRARAALLNFTLVSIHLRPSGKKPQLEVPPLFEAVKEIRGPVIVAGDYNLDSGHSAFDSARDVGFTAAFYRQKTSLQKKRRELSKPYDNFWFRGVALQNQPMVLNLFEKLPDMEAAEIFNNISDHCPIVGEFSLPVLPDHSATDQLGAGSPAN